MSLQFSPTLCVLFCGILLIGSSLADENNEIKHDLFFDGIKMIKGAEKLAIDMKIEKTGPAHFKINGFVEHSIELNNDWGVQLKVSKSETADGEYTMLLTYPPTGPRGVCSMLQKEYKKYFYDSIKDHSTAPHYDTCPLTPNKYTFTDCPFDASPILKILSVGYYRVQAAVIEPSGSGDFQESIEYDFFLHVEDIK